MPDLDPELLDRAVRWCAEAGRHVGTVDVRRALAPLGWDELLVVRALLADPPPARPLGPHALADLARGAPPDVAAERERAGRYRSEDDAGAEEERDRDGSPAGAARLPPVPMKRRRRRGPGVVIRRARDRAAPELAPPASLPPIDELRRPEGRSVLERLVRRHGARRAPIVAALASGWSGPGGVPPGDAELSSLLDHHGLGRAFERRERDEVLHALRAAGGVRGAAAGRLGLDPDGLVAALARLGATAQAERIREDRREELRGRATLAERVRLLLSDEPRLRDLEMLDEFERDLRARLPEHLRALRAGGEPVAAALGRSLSVARPDAEALAARFGLDLGPAAPRAPAAGRGGAGWRPRSGASAAAAARPKPARFGPRHGAPAPARAGGPGRSAKPSRPGLRPRGAPRPSSAAGASSARPAGRGSGPRGSQGSRGPGGPRGSGRAPGPNRPQRQGRPSGPGRPRGAGGGPRRPGGGGRAGRSAARPPAPGALPPSPARFLLRSVPAGPLAER